MEVKFIEFDEIIEMSGGIDQERSSLAIEDMECNCGGRLIYNGESEYVCLNCGEKYHS